MARTATSLGYASRNGNRALAATTLSFAQTGQDVAVIVHPKNTVDNLRYG